MYSSVQNAAPARDGAVSLEPHLTAILNEVTDGLLTFDYNLNVVFTNQRLHAVLDIPLSEDFATSSILHLLRRSAVLDGAAIPDIHTECVDSMNGMSSGGNATITLSDPRRVLSIHVKRLADANFLASFTDVTEPYAAETAAADDATRDPLTGLANRLSFERHLESLLVFTHGATAAGLDGQEIEELADRQAVVLIGLDRLEGHNGTLGQDIGDGLIRLVGKRLGSFLRDSDTVARLGGDQFAMLISPAPDREGMSHLSNRLIEAVSRPYRIGGSRIELAARIGIAFSPHDGCTPDQLIGCANLALSDAKNSGPASFRFFRTELTTGEFAPRT